jgi:hypothetical protein
MGCLFAGTVCDADFLMIQKRDATKPWAKVRICFVPNSVVLVELIKSMSRS